MERVRFYLKNVGEILDGMNDDELLSYLDGLTVLMAPVYLSSSREGDSQMRIKSRMRASFYSSILPESGKRADTRKDMLLMEQRHFDVLSFKACVLDSLRTGKVQTHPFRYECPYVLVSAPGIGYHSRLNAVGVRKLWRFMDKIFSGSEYDRLDTNLVGSCFFDIMFTRNGNSVRFPESGDEVTLIIGKHDSDPSFEETLEYADEFSVVELIISVFSKYVIIDHPESVGKSKKEKSKMVDGGCSIVELPEPIFDAFVLNKLMRFSTMSGLLF